MVLRGLREFKMVIAIETKSEGRREGHSYSPEIRALHERYARTRDLEIRERLILYHMNLVRSLARKFKGRGVQLDDLVQTGTIGLINAIDRFDPDRGIRFSTYATPTIVGEIRRYFRDKENGLNLKVPRNISDLAVRIGKEIDILTQELGRTPEISEIAARMDETEQNIIEAMNLYETYGSSLDFSVSERETSKGGVNRSLGDCTENKEARRKLDLAEQRANEETGGSLWALASRLGDRRMIKILHWKIIDGLTQTEIGSRLYISQMHVSRLLERAKTELRKLAEEEGYAI